ncbi:MAG: multidrug efflux RND transporter permease subunit [Planctomycetota bacterium]
MSRFFIDRPVFSIVVALIMILIGGVSLPSLPVEQYPEIAPPNVEVTASYPGADPATIIDAVTAPLEQEINGVEGMIYMKSTTDQTGRVSINVTFELGTDPDLATVYTQNRVSAAEARLPQEVRARGITVKKRSPSLLMVPTLSSPDSSFDYLALSNYVTLYVKDELARLPGVSEVFIFGPQDYSMRIWLDPEKLASKDLTTIDVLDALRAQNVQVAAGRIGAEPVPSQNGFQYTINTQGRFDSVEQFEDIILKTTTSTIDGQIVPRTVRIKDVARVDLGAESYDWAARLNGSPAIAIGIYQLPGSNATEVAAAVRERMDELSGQFPQGIVHEITFDFTAFVESSIKEVVITLFIATFLVIVITFIFLQSLRATLIPTITIPVSLIATFGVMLAFNFSINLFTLFGLILAIGIVVDDAIVVVENTSRRISQGQDPKTAAKETMDEVTGALVATTLVVLAVFIPAALLGGLTGVLYRQFALTIAFATCFSTINALTLSPMLCSLILKPSKQVRFPLFVLFNKLLDGGRAGYLWFVGKCIRLSIVAVIVFAGISSLALIGVRVIPTGFLPNEDQGYFFVNIQLPDAAKQSRTLEVLERVENMILAKDGVADVIGIRGYSILSGTVAPNSATAIVVLDHWDNRDPSTQGVGAVLGALGMEFFGIQEAIVFPFEPPAIMGIGNAGGVEYELQDRSSSGYQQLQDVANNIIQQTMLHPDVDRAFSGYSASTPQLFVDIDETKAQRMGVAPAVYNDTLQSNLGSTYVNDFNLLGRAYRVTVQAEGRFRDSIDDIARLEVRNGDGETLPIGTFIDVQDTVGPQAINRYNLYPSASINVPVAAGRSTGEGIQAMMDISNQTLPAGYSYEWTGSTYQEQQTGNAAILAFVLGFIVVFLVLAAQYESWSIPISILLTVPLGILGAIAGLYFRGFDINIYTQVGFILLISLVAKNAILIVEFARQLHAEGKSPREAAIEAAKLRFRPILMTGFSFIFGNIPLVIASGAGAMSRQSLGTAVFFGMVFATLIGVVFVPVFYFIIQSITNMLTKNEPRS